MKNVDLIVVGAGFAGLSCAQAAASRGLRTLVIDRKSKAGDNMHTTGLLVKEIAETLPDLPGRLTRKISKVRLYSPDMNYIDLQSPGYYFLATDTSGLMQHLDLQARIAGATMQYGCPFRGAVSMPDHVVLPDLNIQSPYLVGADGARSRVAMHFNLQKSSPMLFGVEAEYKSIEGLDTDCLHVFLDNDIAPGYIAWVVPGVNEFQVGLASTRPHRLCLDRLIKKLRKHFRFSDGQPVSYRAGFIPTGGPLRKYYTDRVILLGDAAGMVSPLTGGGIHPAIEIGQLCGTAIHAHLNHGGPAPHKIINKVMPRYFFKKAMRTLYDRTPLSNQMINRLIDSRLMRSVAQTLFYHKRGLFSFNAWREILRQAR